MSSSPGVASSRPEAGAALDRWLAGLLRGETVEVSALARLDLDAVVARADAHGVLALVADRLTDCGKLPPGWEPTLRGEVGRRAAVDLLREVELRRLIAAFHQDGLRAVLMKGASLAYTVYSRPDLRARVDTDILIDPADRARVLDTLAAQGYAHTGHVTGSLLIYQTCYVKGGADAPAHVVDVHWKIANPQVFADLLGFDVIASDAVAVPALGPGALGTSRVHALFVACVHRVAHHYGAPRLIWLYDVHLLAGLMTDEEWNRFDELVRSRGVALVCRRSLDAAAETLGTRVPSHVAVLADGGADANERQTVAFFDRRRQADTVLSDLRALPTWLDRARLVSQHVFPPATYMRSHYAPASSAPLPVLYARRAVRGAWKWLRRP